MLERLTSADSIASALERISQLIAAHAEWLYTHDSLNSSSLRKSECDFRISHGRLIFSCWTDRGPVIWRITAWEWAGEKLLLEAARRMGAQKERLELVPRASARAAMAAISDTRHKRLRQLAELACAALHGAKVERMALSAGTRRGQPGKTARIMLRQLNRERIAVAAVVTESERPDVDDFLSSALVWFTRACDRRARPPYIGKLWLIVREDDAEPLGQRLALLREELRRIIRLYRIDTDWQALTPVEVPDLDELLLKPTERFRSPQRAVLMSESAAEIVACEPEAIDVVRSRQGETLRFHGLAFARVRRVMNREHIWFGIEGARRRLLDESTQEEWSKLLRDLKEHRRAESPEPGHALYKAAPEAWLETRLRRDITQLDPGLRLAPLYAQFRPSNKGSSRPIDLLALRRDGRLVVIELKVSEDRAHVLQGADYWRRIEIYRRHGHLTRSSLFGDVAIADEPPLVYLVAPLLRVHRAFNLLARTITPSIEAYRFDINEDWRTRVRVLRRCVLT